MSQFNPRFGGGGGKRKKDQPGQYRILIRYLREDGAVTVEREGRGSTMQAALRDADEQLRPGVWTRLLVSTPATIYADLQAMPPNERKRLQARYGQGKTIRVGSPEIEII